jgi:sphinganine-1-phosphate aldolase
MDIEEISQKFRWLPQPVIKQIEKRMFKLPSVKKMIDKENDKMMKVLEHSLKPYNGKFEKFPSIPTSGLGHDKILDMIQQMNDLEKNRWQDGYVSGGIYHGAQEHIDFLNKVYALQSQSNPLHSDLFPSATKFEAEIVSMVAHLHGKNKAPGTADVCGTVTSGGTESILLAMKTYRDKARDEKGITEPEMIVPVTAHAAFDKASQYFNIKQVKVPIDNNYRADVKAVKRAINNHTIAIAGSAPTFPHGAFDPIEEMSDLALKHGIGFHTDSCLGGFVAPFAEKLGYKVPLTDFRLPGVTSISVDTHKYGYAAKGASVVMYRDEDLRHYQFYTTTEWPYTSPPLWPVAAPVH